MPAKRRKRRIPLVSGRAERKSPCRIHFLRGRGGTAYAPARDAGERKLMRVRLTRTALQCSGLPPRTCWCAVPRVVAALRPPSAPLSQRGWNQQTRRTQTPLGSTPVPVQLRPPRPMRPCVDGARQREDGAALSAAKGEPCGCPLGGMANNRRPGGFKNRRAPGRVGVQVAPAAPVFRRVVECIHASLRNSWARARAGASPVPPTNFRRVVQSEPSGLYPESR